MLKPSIEEISEHSLGNAEEAAIASLLARCFQTDFGGRSYFAIRHTWRHILREDDRVIAHIGVQLRAVRLGPQVITVAGFADVATDPAARGRGLAAALVQAGIARARQTLARHVLLFGTAGLYAAAGFRPVSNPMSHLCMSSGVTRHVDRHPARDLMVLDLSETPWDTTAELDLLGPMF